MSSKQTVARPELTLRRVFSSATVNPYGAIKWETRTALLTNKDGETIFEQKDVEVPESWSQQATNIVVSKYFYGKVGTPERETSVRQLVQRVVDTIGESAVLQGYFEFDSENYHVFVDELAAILLTQRAAFNSPVWFNVGLHRYEPKAKAEHWSWKLDETIGHAATGYHTPQCSACFINSVEDSMSGIMELARTEALLFKYGSGTGTNFSALRSSKETVSGGGTASGPLSFMKGLDAFAGAIKSGGKTRRAAKMAILNVDHPDIEEFIDCKRTEELKAYALMREGYDGTSGPDSEAYSSVFFQNANNSVRVGDDFMLCVTQLNDELVWNLKTVKDGRTVKTVKAHALMRKIAEAAWACGDPGMQFDTTINKWHPCPNSGRQNATNPCSEYSFLDNSACNLASINLLKFLRKNNTFDVDGFKHTVDVMILAQDVLVDLSGYPTEKIAKNSHDFRPLGLGYANLGALLMVLGLPYDSDAGRAYAACITAIMTGEAYRMSSELAALMPPVAPAGSFDLGTNRSGACPGYFPNSTEFLKVIGQHYDQAALLVEQPEVPVELARLAAGTWHQALEQGRASGYRNAQVTVLAPTGTIGFLMDCATTGIEPELGLIKFKRLVGGGQMKIVNEMVGRALSKLGYKGELADAILMHIEQTGSVEGSDLADGHLAVFDTAFKPVKGTRSIHYLGHIRMMAAVQPFLSGAISKTVNLPEEATVEDIEEAYIVAWKSGLKAVAVYRDGSKKNQVLVASSDNSSPVAAAKSAEQVNLSAPPKAVRHKLPPERPAINNRFSLGGYDGYVNIGLYPEGQPGEMFLNMSKGGSTVNGMFDCFAIAVSLGLQYGVPAEAYVDKLSHTRFEPSGFVAGYGYCTSVVDYLMRWVKKRFIDQSPLPFFDSAFNRVDQPILLPPADVPNENTTADELSSVFEFGDAPPCNTCGSIMVRNGSCYKCMECGSTSGCS